MTHYDVVLVGAGFCGTMVAVNLARTSPHLSVALVERNPTPAQGLAYGTTDPGHLLNVRAGQMGAFADQPDHFIGWLRDNPKAHPGATERDFVPRMVYGRYLGSLLDAAKGITKLRHFITDIESLPGGGFKLLDAHGSSFTAARVVLALGNFPPDQSAGMTPYDPATWATIADNGDVLIVGTGLTSLDLVVTMAKTKPSGTIHMLSRHGLLPRVHVNPEAYMLKMGAPFPKTAGGLLAALRREIADVENVPWQSVIDALRPHNQKLWQDMGQTEQRRFLRHLRAYWDVHRHRCAPEIMATCDALEKAGRLKLHHGSIVKQVKTGQGWAIDWRPRGQHDIAHLNVRHVVRATGPQADFTKLDDVLVQNLLRRKLITPDALRLGIAADGFSPLGADGNKVPGLLALGSLLKGALYESVAVPELRGQAAAVAGLIDKEAAPL